MSVRKSVVTPARSRIFLAIGSSLVMVAGMLFGANAAAADSVQVQSYQRASQTATCDSPPESMSEWRASWANPSDPISGPTWHPSWERWANNGSGGWTCTRSITWARSATSARSYAVGDIGPGGGLVFLISGGKTYEMAPNTWSGSSSDDTPLLEWCNNTSLDVRGADGTAVGDGSANTALMIAVGACTSGAANEATAYSEGGFTDWFLPSRDELNAMYTYSQVSGFDTVTYGIASGNYWSSSQSSTNFAWYQDLGSGYQSTVAKSDPLRVRPIRAF